MTERGAPDDPFDGVTFDEAFVRSAPVREDTADERIQRWRHIDEQHRRIVEEARAHVREQRAAMQPPEPRRRGNRGRWAVIVVGLAIVAFFWVRSQESTQQTSSPSPPVDAARPIDDVPAHSAVRFEGGQPPPGVDVSPRPLGVPAPFPPGGGHHEFVAMQPDGRNPVAYDPCRPVRVVMNMRTAPPGAETLLREALDEVSAATGLQFTIDGATDEPPREDRPPYQPSRYPGRWAPVLVAWSDPTDVPALDGHIAGQGGSSWFELPSGSVFVTGMVALDGPDIGELLSSPDGRDVARAIVMHELGHLVGLGHVDDPSQLMYPETSGAVTAFGAGDRQGLAALGSGRCFPDI